jgi:3-oxoacyl-[acyl-carrier protein] reductase
MLSQPVVLITGAARGLGRAMALAFGRHGYAVGINYRNSEDEAKKTLALVTESKVSAALFKADVSSPKDVQAMMKAVQDKWGRLDVLINNAGVVHNQLISKMTDEEWRNVLSVNLDGVFYTTRSAIPLMRDRKGGAIINVASFAATKGIRGAANYAAAKAGVVTLTKNTALEEGSFNIRANAVMPGFHVTDMNTDVWKKYEESIRSQHLLKELPKKEEMAEFVVRISELTTVSGQVFAFESRLS